MQQPSWLVDTWVKDLTQVLEMMTGQTPEVAWSPAASAADDTSLWWRQSFSAIPGSVLCVGATARGWSDIGAAALRAAGVDLFEQSEARSTYLEIVQQSLASLATSIGTRLGKTNEAIEGALLEDDPAEPVIASATVSADGMSVVLYLAASQPLVSAFAVRSEPVPEAPAAPVAAPSEPPASGARVMDFLLDVELPVSISFGHATVPLKDVLKLTTGSVVELDRQPEDPVDVIVNNTVIARGEVVVVEGNYGVRISQIINRQQRLALRNGARVSNLRPL